jgi:glycosyltransferase involved in cell wall biosynthesis
MAPLVSILIPAYNAEPWIANTIKFALSIEHCFAMTEGYHMHLGDS